MSKWGSAIIGIIMVSSVLFADPTANVQINADIFELDGQTNQILASGNVVVHQADVVMVGGKAWYTKAKNTVKMIGGITLTKGKVELICDTVVANGLTNTIDAEGNISFHYDTIKGTSARSRFDIDQQKIFLSGNPVVWQNNDKISGDKVVIDLSTKKVQTMGQAKILLSLNELKKGKE